MSVEFMQKMLNSYGRVHNKRYWAELTSVISSEGFVDKTVIDLGCGPGLLLADLGSKFDISKIIGIDLSPIMLERAEMEIKKGLGTKSDEVELELIQQHLQDNSTLPSDLDFVFSSRVLRSFEDQPKIMNSIYQSLNPGGHLIILDWTKESIKTYEKWFQSLENEFNNLSPEDIIAYHRNFSRYDLEDWTYILHSTGFKVIHSYQLDPVHSVIIASK